MNMWFRKNVNGEWRDTAGLQLKVLPNATRTFPFYFTSFGNNSFWSPRCLGFDSCGRKGRWPRLLLSCCFRVTLFRSKISNKVFFFTFALHHAVKTIQGRGCSSAQHARTHAGVISGADELFFSWEALTPQPTGLSRAQVWRSNFVSEKKLHFKYMWKICSAIIANLWVKLIVKKINKQTNPPKNSNLSWYLASVVEHNYTF